MAIMAEVQDDMIGTVSFGTTDKGSIVVIINDVPVVVIQPHCAHAPRPILYVKDKRGHRHFVNSVERLTEG